MISTEKITMGTLLQMAQKAGWQRKHHRPITDAMHQKRRLKPIAWGELHLMPKREYLIKGLLDCSAMSVVYGESNCGKTFLSLDVSIHITLGKQWCGMKVKQGAVVYIAAEGGMGLEERMKAFHQHHKLDSFPPFHLIPAGIDLCNSEEDCEELIEEIKQISNVQLIVVDTLSRAMSGGNENSPDDMGAFIKNCDLLREAVQAHVMIIHHCGKDSAKGARGHSALRAAVDTEIEVKKTDELTVAAEITKQRDGKTGIIYGFLLSPMPLGLDSEGDLKSSCVLVPSAEALVKRKALKGNKKLAVKVLESLLRNSGQIQAVGNNLPDVLCVPLADYRSELAKAQICSSDKPDNIRRVISQLIGSLNNEGITSISGEFIWISDNADKTG